MNTSFPQSMWDQRFPQSALDRESGTAGRATDRGSSESTEGETRWMVDLTALSRCRQLLARNGSTEAMQALDARESQHALMDVPAAYDLFCRTHFASVRRMHPDLSWNDACPAYAIALSTHAVLCVALDDERERQLELSWPWIRGDSTLAWAQARRLVADGCSALDRIDPLAMRR